MNDDLISRSALLKKALVPFPGAFSSMISSWEVATAPAVDAIIPVRCKDCEHLMFSDCYGECRIGHMGIVQPDDFCSYGKRRADE